MTKLNGNTRNAYTRRVLRALRQIAEHNVSNGLVFVHPEGADESAESGIEEKSMASTLLKYRAGYVAVTTKSGKKTVDKGDELAVALRDLSAEDVCAVADAVFGDLPGTHSDRYEGLNPGQRRMNAGNRLRAALRNGKATIEQVLAAIDGDYEEADADESELGMDESDDQQEA